MKKVMARLHRMFKEEKGLTLIELLAVIVILGIIAAIAVPAITGITGNTKKEAHKANAHQMIEAAKQMVAVNGFKANHTVDSWTPNTVSSSGTITTGTAVTGAKTTVMDISLANLVSAGYFTNIKDPEAPNGVNYTEASQYVRVYNTGTTLVYYITIDSSKTDFTDIPESEIDNLRL